MLTSMATHKNSKLSVLNSERLRKQRASPLNTVAMRLMKESYSFLYKNFRVFVKNMGLKTQKTLKNPCLIMKLIISYEVLYEKNKKEMTIAKLFQNLDQRLDQEIKTSYNNKQFQELMKLKCHSDLDTIRSAFSCDLQNQNEIYQSLRPLYDKQIVDQHQHRKNRRLLAQVIHKYSISRNKGQGYQIISAQNNSSQSQLSERLDGKMKLNTKIPETPITQDHRHPKQNFKEVVEHSDDDLVSLITLHESHFDYWNHLPEMNMVNCDFNFKPFTLKSCLSVLQINGQNELELILKEGEAKWPSLDDGSLNKTFSETFMCGLLPIESN